MALKKLEIEVPTVATDAGALARYIGSRPVAAGRPQLAAFAQIDRGVTILVLPGISAFGIKTPHFGREGGEDDEARRGEDAVAAVALLAWAGPAAAQVVRAGALVVVTLGYGAKRTPSWLSKLQ